MSMTKLAELFCDLLVALKELDSLVLGKMLCG